jgi:two-component system, NtrC family, sensor histidine kinase GlrK
VHVSGPRDMVSLGDQLNWLRQRLIELEEQKVRFFRQVSHELKTPLASLWEAVDLLSNKVVGDLSRQQEEIVDIMHGSVRILRQRIEELLNYQHVLHQTNTKEVASVPLESLIEEVARNVDLPLKAKRLTLSTAVSGVTLEADRELMAVVLDNLLSNAIRFSPEAGIVEVRAERLAHEVRISVCDQGPGVPKADGNHIFQPFYRGCDQPSGSIQGSGLGLAIARAHVEAHGGSLCLEDDRSSGTCFTIRLPLDKEVLSEDS